jgi:hypothetical protein
MQKSSTPMLLLLGVGALAIVSRKKKRRPPSSKIDSDDSELIEEDEGEEVIDLPEEGVAQEWVEPAKSPQEILLSLEDARGKARLGSLYQIKKGDTLLKIAREALYGTRATIQDPDKRDAVVEFSVLIDCGPWNQAVAGRSSRFLKQGHAAINRGSALGISFDPIYTDNRLRMLNGMAPSGAAGNSYAYIWIPMINLDLLDSEGIVTTKDMDWPDTEDGRGHSMIDPPNEILSLGFDDVTHREVGCKLADGDFRRVIETRA